MNRVHKLYKKYKTSTEVQTKKKVWDKSATVMSICICLALVALGILLYTPMKYSTVVSNSIVKEMTEAITGEQGGIVASNIEHEVEGYDYKVKSSQDFIMEQGDKQLNILKRCKELNILDTNVNIDDLWAIYYAYFSDDYNANLGLYSQLTAWYSDLQNSDSTGYEYTCDNNCSFVTELSPIVAVEKNALKSSNAHAVYHKQIDESIASLEITEAELQQLYEAYLLTNPEYVESITLDLTLLHTDLTEKNKPLADWALNTNNFLVNWLLGDIKNTITLNKAEVAEVMKYIDFTEDSSIITDEIVILVPNAVRSYGIEMGLDTGNTTIVNITGVEDIEKWLSENGNKTSVKNTATDNKFIDCGFARLYWDIIDIDYVDNIPTLEQLSKDPAWVNEVYFRLMEQAVWQKFYSGE